MMKNCETCAYWDRSDVGEDGYSLGLGVCNKIGMYWDSTEWSMHGHKRQFIEEVQNEKAFLNDSNDYRTKAVLTCKSDFGCVQHKDK